MPKELVTISGLLVLECQLSSIPSSRRQSSKSGEDARCREPSPHQPVPPPSLRQSGSLGKIIPGNQQVTLLNVMVLQLA